MKLFKTCLAAAIACSLFYSFPVNKIQEATTEVIDVPCVQASPQELLSDGYSPPDTLQKMLSPEYKNTLILCTDGSEMLYDSIFIIGHNKAANSVKVISLPRDLYVPYGEEIRQQLVTHNLVQEKGIFKLNIAGFIGQKINYPSTCFEDGDISFMADTIQAMTGVVVSNYAIFNFKTFEQLVDTVGGITLNIPMDIRDGNGTLLLPKGTQTLSGKEALLYARTRKFYDETGNLLPSGGDFTRKEHQMTIIRELVPQLIQNAGITKLPAILQIMHKEVRHSFGIGDFYRYYKLIQDVAEGTVDLETLGITGPEIQPLQDGCLYIEFK